MYTHIEFLFPFTEIADCQSNLTIMMKTFSIFTNILDMDGAKQKTFDIGISRKMAPSAHMIVYYVRYDGEIVADSLNFHVDISSVKNHVNITVNRRKDFTGNTVEILAYAYILRYIAHVVINLIIQFKYSTVSCSM